MFSSRLQDFNSERFTQQVFEMCHKLILNKIMSLNICDNFDKFYTIGLRVISCSKENIVSWELLFRRQMMLIDT